MRLTRFTDVALRVLMRLTVTTDGEDPPTTREVAATMEVPYTHAAKVVARLQHLGLVDARRGRGGGLTLTTAGRSASIGTLVRELEGPGEVVECEGDTPCPLRSACRPPLGTATGRRGLLRLARPAHGQRSRRLPHRPAPAGHQPRPPGAGLIHRPPPTAPHGARRQDRAA